jgi:membrane protease YdiL (CAAX protease family)
MSSRVRQAGLPIGKAVVLALVVPALTIIGGVVSGFTEHSTGSREGWEVARSIWSGSWIDTGFSAIALLVVVGAAVVWGGVDAKEFFALRRVPIRPLFVWILLIAGVEAVGLFGVDLFGLSYEKWLPGGLTRCSVGKVWLVTHYVLVTPVLEETYSRGLLFRCIADSKIGSGGAILTTSALWVVTHAPLSASAFALVALNGVLLGLSRWKTQSIYPALLAHALINAAIALPVVLA